MTKELFILLMFEEFKFDTSNSFYKVYEKAELVNKILELSQAYLNLKIKDIVPIHTNYGLKEEVCLSKDFNPFISLTLKGYYYADQEKNLIEKSEGFLKIHSVFVDYLRECIINDYREVYQEILDKESKQKSLHLIVNHMKFNPLDLKIFKYFACEKEHYHPEILRKNLISERKKFPF